MGQDESDQRQRSTEIYSLLVDTGLDYVLPPFSLAILLLGDAAPTEGCQQLAIEVIKRTGIDLLFMIPSFPTRQELEEIIKRIATGPDESIQAEIDRFWRDWID